LSFREKERGGSFLFSKLAEAFIGADSWIFEDAPLAAYVFFISSKACQHPSCNIF